MYGIIIENLPVTVTKGKLRKMFNQEGIKRVYLIPKYNCQNGYIVFHNKRLAKIGISHFNKTSVDPYVIIDAKELRLDKRKRLSVQRCHKHFKHPRVSNIRKLMHLFKKLIYFNDRYEKWEIPRLSLKKRIEEADLFHELHIVQKFVKYPKRIRRLFLGCMLYWGKAPKKGFRKKEHFSLVQSIYRKSEEYYDFYSKYFNLPAKVEFDFFVSRSSIKAGIYNHIFPTLKVKVNKLHPQDRSCAILFDSLSLRPMVLRNPFTDELEGYVDLGEGKRTRRLANQVLCFLIRGLTTGWFQPVAHFFNNESNAELIVETIKTLVKMLHEIGLKVVTIIFKATSVNQTAIKSLVGESKPPRLAKKAAKRNKKTRAENERNRNLCFQIIPNQDIFPLYDVFDLDTRTNCTYRDGILVIDSVYQPDEYVTSFYHLLRLNRHSPNHPLTANSPEWQFWVKAKNTLKKMEYAWNSGKKCHMYFKMWVEFIENLENLFSLMEADGHKEMDLRFFNICSLDVVLGKIKRLNRNDPFQIMATSFLTAYNLTLLLYPTFDDKSEIVRTPEECRLLVDLGVLVP